MKWFENPVRNKTRLKQLYLALAVTFFGNLLLAVIKWAAAVYSGSSALKSDAWNSVSDVLYSITLIIGLLIAVKPADLSHPHGHERFEPVVGVGISLSMCAAGFIALMESWQKISGGQPGIPDKLSVLVLIPAAAIKLVMYFIINKISQKIANRALAAAAKDNLMDVLTSAAAAIGVLLSIHVHPLADPIAGLLLALWILRTAVTTFVENLNYLTGHGTSEKTLHELRSQIEAVPGVLGVHQLYAEYVGTKMRLDVHIDMDGSVPLEKVHEVETEIEKRMAARGDIEHVFIHAEPKDHTDE